MKRVASVSVVCAMMTVAGLAFAQVAPPPPSKPAQTPEFKLPDAPPPEAAPARPAQPAAQPRQPQPQTQAYRAWETDAAGMPLPLEKPVEWAALERNPMVGNVTMPRVTPFLQRRQHMFYGAVIDNLDLVRRLTAGMIENMDMANRTQMGEVLVAIKPLSGGKTLTNTMREENLLTAMQTRQNQAMSQDYFRVLLAAKRKAAEAAGTPWDKNTEAKEFTAMMLGRQVEEALFWYDDLLLESAGKLESDLGAAGLDAAAIKALDAEISAVKGASDRPGRVKAMRALASKLSQDQEKAVLEAARTRKPKPEDLAPVDEEKSDIPTQTEAPKADAPKADAKP
jgi:hypothetical protein